jgi:hypothetical protein
MQRAKRQKRNAVEAIDSAGAGPGKKPPTLPSPASDLRAGRGEGRGLCFPGIAVQRKLIQAEYQAGRPSARPLLAAARCRAQLPPAMPAARRRSAATRPLQGSPTSLPLAVRRLG